MSVMMDPRSASAHGDSRQGFIDGLNHRAAQLAGPVVVFGIPLRARPEPVKWSIIQHNLRATLANLRRQSDPNFLVMLAGHDLPDMGPYGDGVLWVEAHWKAPESPAGYSNDKSMKRRLMLSLIRRSSLEKFYFFTLDADDYIDPSVCDHIRSDHNKTGYYIDRGYMYDASAGLLGQSTAENAPLYKHSGSCSAFWLTRDDLPERASDTSTIWTDISLAHNDVPNRMAAAGRPVTAFPFEAGLHLINHGANNKQEKGRSDRNTKVVRRTRIHSAVKVQNVLRRFGVSLLPMSQAVSSAAADGRSQDVPTGRPAKEAPKRPTSPHPRGEATGPGPDFLCIGLQKAGTRWLYDQMQGHADVWMPPFKELHYFDSEFPPDGLVKVAKKFLANPDQIARMRQRFGEAPVDERGAMFFRSSLALRGWPSDLEDYAWLFEPKGSKVSGDVTPDYCALNEALVGALARRFPQAKVCLLLREPVSRVWSAWRMANRKWSEAQPDKPDPSRREASDRLFEIFLSRPSVIARSYPSRIAARWSAAFGERFRFFFLDDIIRHPVETREDLLGFLGVDPGKPSLFEAGYNRKAGEAGVPRTPKMQKLLRDRFAEERRRCVEMFGGAAAKWPDAPY